MKGSNSRKLTESKGEGFRRLGNDKFEVRINKGFMQREDQSNKGNDRVFLNFE